MIFEITSPFQKNLLEELRTNENIDEISLEELTHDLSNQILNENIQHLFSSKSIFSKLKRVFTFELNDERIFFIFEEKEKMDFECFKSKHINELLKHFYNVLIRLLLGKYFLFFKIMLL